MAKVKCQECKGKGEIPCTMEYGGFKHPDNCPVCGGDSSVRITCPDCEGEGKVDNERY